MLIKYLAIVAMLILLYAGQRIIGINLVSPAAVGIPAVAVALWLFVKWRRRMRINEQIFVPIQFIDA